MNNNNKKQSGSTPLPQSQQQFKRSTTHTTVSFDQQATNSSNKASPKSSFVWNVFKALGKPLHQNGEQGYKEQLFQLEDRLRGSRLFWLKSLSLLIVMGYVPYEMRRSMENGNASRDNLVSLVRKHWALSAEKQEKINHLFD